MLVASWPKVLIRDSPDGLWTTTAVGLPNDPITIPEISKHSSGSDSGSSTVEAWHGRRTCLLGQLGPPSPTPRPHLVTNLRRRSWQVVKFYNGRATAEQWIKEGKNAVKWTLLSCHDFVDNQVRLQLFALAYNLGNFLRRLALPRSVKHWSLTTLREKLIKIGAKVVTHSPYVNFQKAELAARRKLFPEIHRRNHRLQEMVPG